MEIMEEKRNLNPQLNLQWHQHHDTLVSLLKLLWEKQELVDVTLVAAGGRTINVHRIVLCACSKYFQDVLTMKSSSDKQAIIFLKDISYEDLQGLVDYMYKGEVRVNQDQLNSFLYSAKSLGIRGLMDAENNMTSNSIKDERRKKRRRSISSVSSCGTGITEPMVLHPPDGTSSSSAVPPPLPSTTQPQLLNHNNKMMHHHHHPGVKMEPPMPNASNHYHQDMSHHFHHPPDFMDALAQTHNSQSISAQEIEDDDLEMLQYAVRPGPSNGNNGDGLSNMHQDSSGGFSCGRCGRIYQWRSTLQRHAKYECNVEPGFICPICQAPFHHKNVLQRHLNTRHHKS